MAIAAHSTTTSRSARPKRRRSAKPHVSKREAARLLALRDRLEQHLEAMVAFLDEWDGDPDLEPSLGSAAPHQQVTQEIWATGVTDDREQECEDEGAGNEDDEPSLGSSENHPGKYGGGSQGAWSTGYPGDIEGDHADSEPSLGWPETGSGCQSLMNTGVHDEREGDCEDEGAQCDDEGDRTSDMDFDEACGGLE